MAITTKTMSTLLKVYPENPNPKAIRQIVEVLEKGGVIIYPTDTIYALGCDISKPKAIERLAQIKGIQLKKANFSLICYDLSHISEFVTFVSNPIFKIMRRNLPGAFTFILNANNNVPRVFKHKKKTIGLRVPDNNIARTIVKELGNPIVTTSIHHEDDILEYYSDPELIFERYQKKVDIIIDGGYGENTPSTIIDCTYDEPVIIRQGKGELFF